MISTAMPPDMPRFELVSFAVPALSTPTHRQETRSPRQFWLIKAGGFVRCAQVDQLREIPVAGRD